MESLTKENFWNDMDEKYPEAMKVFKRWLEEYKLNMQWAATGDSIKYHDLPIEMQIGIWLGFAREKELLSYGCLQSDEYIEWITGALHSLEKQLNQISPA